jgi:hypothetical protein
VIAVIGAGGALAAAKLAPYRIYLLGGSYTFLGIGFWRAYGRRDRSEGRACPARTGRVLKVMLWFSALTTLAATALSFFM